MYMYIILFLSVHVRVSNSSSHSLSSTLSPLSPSLPLFLSPPPPCFFPSLLFTYKCPLHAHQLLFLPTHASVVQLKDVQGHLYNLINATVRFSEPQNEPIPDAKLRMELANVVRNTTSLRNGKVPSTIEVGNIKAQGKKRHIYTYTRAYRGKVSKEKTSLILLFESHS